MILPFIGAVTLIEVLLFLTVILPLALSTSEDRNGKNSFNWWIAIYAIVAWCVYSIIVKDDSAHFFSVAFWTTSTTWLAIGKYLAIGLAYVLLEMTVDIFEERRRVKKAWSQETFERQGEQDTAYRTRLERFCSNWNRDRHLVELRTHALDDVPHPAINMSTLQRSVFNWIIFWPGYLVSLFLGRILDRLFNYLLKTFRLLGTGLMTLVFRNTFNHR